MQILQRDFNFQSVCHVKLLPRGQLLTKLSHGLTLDWVSREDVLGWTHKTGMDTWAGAHRELGTTVGTLKRGWPPLQWASWESKGQHQGADGAERQLLTASLWTGKSLRAGLAKVPAPARAEPVSWLWSLPSPGLCSVMWLHITALQKLIWHSVNKHHETLWNFNIFSLSQDFLCWVFLSQSLEAGCFVLVVSCLLYVAWCWSVN